jgi:predicted PurR-regulated permease PerM
LARETEREQQVEGPIQAPEPRISLSGPSSASADMPRWIPKLLVTILAFLAGAWLLLGFLRQITDLITWLIVAMFFAFAIEPAVNWLAARGWRRGVATALMLAVVGGLGVVLMAAMIPLVVSQVEELIGAVPGWLDRLAPIADNVGIDLSSGGLTDSLSNADDRVRGFATNIAGNLLGVGAAVLGVIFQLFTIGLFIFYFVAEGPRFRRAICSLLRPSRQREVLWAWEVAIDKTGGYFYSRLLLALISGSLTFVILTILGVPFAVPLALWMGLVSQFVPVIGTYIAAVLPLLVAFLTGVSQGVVLLVYIVLYQQVENLFLGPKISAKTMNLHPAVAFAAAIAGGSVQGIVGAFLALPAAAIVQAFLGAYVHRHEVMQTELTMDVQPIPTVRPRRSWKERFEALRGVRDRKATVEPEPPSGQEPATGTEPERDEPGARTPGR